jgi:hypothetical protein
MYDMRRPNNSFWLAAVAAIICMVAIIGGSSAFTVFPSSTKTTRATGPSIFLNKPIQLDRIGIRSRCQRQPHNLHLTTTRLRMMRMGGGGGRGSMGIGIQTAQLLLDKRRHDELKRNIKVDYPLVPDSVLDICIDITAKAFTTVAPEKIRNALQPGKMEQAQPALKKALVSAALDQKVIRNMPVLTSKDKEALLGNVVDLALRFVLRDAKAALAAPEVRLQALEEQVRNVKAQMGPLRLARYRLRTNPLQVAAPVLLALSAVLAYAQRDDPTVVTVTNIARRVFSKLVVPLVTLVPNQAGWMFHSSRSQVMSWLVVVRRWCCH